MIYVIVIAIIAIADLLIKNSIERYYWNNKDRYIFGKFVKIHESHNTGGFMNFLENSFEWVKMLSGILLLIVAVIFGFLLPKKGKCLLKSALALILGGALSNQVDRVFKKDGVTDYFSVQIPGIKKIVFNIGDFAIFIGVILLLVNELKKD